MKNHILTAFMIAVALLVSASSVSAATIFNGSFEMVNTPDTDFVTAVSGDSTTIPDWTVVSGDVDLVGTYWNSYEGRHSIDLNGFTAGAIAQTFATEPGHTYTVTFYMAGNPDGGPVLKTLAVDTGGAPQEYAFDNTDRNDLDMGWVKQTYVFTATGTQTTLTFRSTTDSFDNRFGPALDNVTIDN